MQKLHIIPFVITLLILSSCSSVGLYYTSIGNDFRKASWSLRSVDPEFPNYLSDDEIIKYDQFVADYEKNNSGAWILGFSLAAEIDSRNLIRHLVHTVISEPGKSEYYIKIVSDKPESKGGIYRPSVSGSVNIDKDTFPTFKKHLVKEVNPQFYYSDHNGYGEVLVGDGSHVIRYWASARSNEVRIGVKNLNNDPVDPSRFNDKKITEEVGLKKRYAMEQAMVKIEQAIAKREAEEARQKYWDNMPSDMTFDPDGNPEWGAYRAEKRQEKAAEQAAYQQVIRTLADPNSHIYQNNRMSDQNLAKNYKPKPDEERYGKSDYQEFSKPTVASSSRVINKYTPSSEIDTVNNSTVNNTTNSLKERCLANPKSKWINGGCVITHEFTNKRNCYNSGGRDCKTGDLVDQQTLQPSWGDQTSLSISSSSSVPAVNTSKIKGFISNGRTKIFYSDSGNYYKRDLARELAQIGIENNATEFCDSGLKAKIEWIDNECDKSTNSEQHKCWQRALVLCSSNYCESSFCGTGRTKD